MWKYICLMKLKTNLLVFKEKLNAQNKNPTLRTFVLKIVEGVV